MSGLLPRGDQSNQNFDNITCNQIRSNVSITKVLQAASASIGALTITNLSVDNVTVDGDVTLTDEPPIINGTGNAPTNESALMWDPATGIVSERLDIINATGAQNMSNKNIISPSINEILNISNANAPITFNATSGNDEFVTTFATQDMISKGFNSASCYFYANTGADRKIVFDPSTASNGTTTTFRTSQTANRTVTFPNASDTVVMLGQTQVLTSKTLDTASNNINISSGSLSSTSINLVLNQALLTTSSPTFSTLTLTTGALLPTTGGTPTTLNYYEEGTFNLTFTGTFSTTVACNFVRVGKNVNFNMNWSTNAASTGTFFTTSSLPARLTPAIAIDTQIWVMDNSVWQTTPGRILVAGTSISVYKANQTTAFTAAGTAAFGNWSWTWRV